jgi:hypothetical protein
LTGFIETVSVSSLMIMSMKALGSRFRHHSICCRSRDHHKRAVNRPLKRTSQLAGCPKDSHRYQCLTFRMQNAQTCWRNLRPLARFGWLFPFKTLLTICSVNGRFVSVRSKVLVSIRKLSRRSNRRRFLCRGDLPVSLISRIVTSAIELSR